MVKDKPLECHPMRIDALCDHFNIKNGIITIYDIFNSVLEKELIRYSIGKLSIKEIISVLQGKDEFKDYGKSLSEEILKFYQEADKQQIMVFSRY